MSASDPTPLVLVGPDDERREITWAGTPPPSIHIPVCTSEDFMVPWDIKNPPPQKIRAYRFVRCIPTLPLTVPMTEGMFKATLDARLDDDPRNDYELPIEAGPAFRAVCR